MLLLEAVRKWFLYVIANKLFYSLSLLFLVAPFLTKDV
jgi:hypothetical protein